MAEPDGIPEIISRRDAKAAGLTHYFTGQPCIHGHIAARHVRRKHCVECHRVKRALVRATQPDIVKAQKAASYLRHRDSVLVKVKGYQAANAPVIHQRQKAFREANKPKIAKRMKVWSKANRPLLRQHERNRRARERGAEGTHTAAEVATLLEKQKGRCAAPGCRKNICADFHVDHVKPLAKGGTNWISNIQLLCPTHNQSKHARDPIEWAQSLGSLL